MLKNISLGKNAYLLALPLPALFFYGYVLHRCGASVFGAGVFAIAFIFLLLLPGRFFTAFLRLPAAGQGVASVVLGCAFFAVCTACAAATGWHKLTLLVPLLFGLLGAAAWWRQSFVAPLQTTGMWQSQSSVPYLPLLRLCAFFLVVFSFSMVSYAHPSAFGAIIPVQDFYHNLGLAASFLKSFPPQNLHLAGDIMRYHYATELVAAGFAMATGLPLYDILQFYFTPAVLLLVVVCLWQCGVVLFKSNAQRWFFIFCIFFSGCAGMHKVWQRGSSPFLNSFAGQLLTNLNSVANTVLFLTAFTTLAALAVQGAQNAAATPARPKLQGGANTVGLTFCAAVAYALLMFTKAPVAAIVAVAVVLALLLFALQGQAAALPLATCVSALFAFGVLFFASSAGAAVVFNPAATLYRGYFTNILAALNGTKVYPFMLPVLTLAHALLTAPLLTFLFLCSLPFALKNFFRLSFAVYFAYAAAIGGMAAFFMFEHAAFSQVYFLYCSLYFLAAVAAINLPQVAAGLQKLAKPLRAVAVATVAVLLLAGSFSAACGYAQVVQKGVSLLVNPGAAIEAEQNRTPLTAAEEEAMEWLCQNSPEDAVFATNRIHSGRAEEGYSFVYSALARRAAFAEAVKTGVCNNGLPEEEINRRIATVNFLFGGATAREIKTTCLQEGISYLVFAHGAAGAWVMPAGLPVVFTNTDVTIYYTGG